MTQGQTYSRCGAVSIRLSRVLMPVLRRFPPSSGALRQALPVATALILLPGMALAHEPDPAAELRFYATIVLWMSVCLCALLMIGATHWSQYLLAILLSSLMPLALLMIILVAAVRAKDAENTSLSTPPGIETLPEEAR